MHTFRHHDWREPRAARGVASRPSGVLVVGAVSVSPKISWGPVVESRALASFFGCAMPPDPIGVARCCEPRKWGRPLSGALKVARPPQRSVPRDIHHLATLR